MSWGKLIAEIRQEQGFTQRALAQQVGINRSTLRRIEIGQPHIDVRVLEQVLNFLGYDLEAVEQAAKADRLVAARDAQANPRGRSEVARKLLLLPDIY